MSIKEKQNKLLKVILVISTLILLFGLYDCAKALNSSEFMFDKIKEAADIYLDTNKEKANAIIDTGSTLYKAFKTLKVVLIHISKTLINMITLSLLCISRLVLNGNVTKTKSNIAKVINFIALLVLFILIMLLFEINLADLVTELETFNVIVVFKMLGKLVEMSLFILEMLVIIRYTFLTVKVKGEQYE